MKVDLKNVLNGSLLGINTLLMLTQIFYYFQLNKRSVDKTTVDLDKVDTYIRAWKVRTLLYNTLEMFVFEKKNSEGEVLPKYALDIINMKQLLFLKKVYATDNQMIVLIDAIIDAKKKDTVLV